MKHKEMRNEMRGNKKAFSSPFACMQILTGRTAQGAKRCSGRDYFRSCAGLVVAGSARAPKKNGGEFVNARIVGVRRLKYGGGGGGASRTNTENATATFTQNQDLQKVIKISANRRKTTTNKEIYIFSIRN